MRLEITPELAELRPAVRRFMTARLEPIAEEIDRTRRIPDEAWHLMREQGWLGMLLPPEYGGGWRINGRKHGISGGHAADVVMVMAVTGPAKRARGGISTFLVERGTPGFEVTRVDTTIGSAAIELGELTFTDCVVPEEALLGAEDASFAIAMGSLVNGRLGVAHACLGTADRLLEMSVAHAKRRVTFGKPLAERQAIRWMLADSEAELQTARAFATRRSAASRPAACSEMVGRVADRAVQVHGGMGLVRGFPVERFDRDIRHYRVGEGSSEVQRMLIARDLLR
jgi:acyl-CoA dehydrogenase